MILRKGSMKDISQVVPTVEQFCQAAGREKVVTAGNGSLTICVMVTEMNFIVGESALNWTI